MDSKQKILIGVALVLALISGIFLLLAKKPNTNAAQTNTATNATVASSNTVSSTAPKAGGLGAQGLPVESIAGASVNSSKTPPSPVQTAETSSNATKSPTANTAAAVTAPATATSQPVKVDHKSAEVSQWKQCKAGTAQTGAIYIWNVQITEAIPAGGTYAKGFLENDQQYLVHVTIKSGISNADKIKSLLSVGKMAFLRSICAGTASDGAVVVQAF